MKASLFVLVFVLIVLAALVALMPSGVQAQISEPATATPAFDCLATLCSVYLPESDSWTCQPCVPTPFRIVTPEPVKPVKTPPPARFITTVHVGTFDPAAFNRFIATP